MERRTRAERTRSARKFSPKRRFGLHGGVGDIYIDGDGAHTATGGGETNTAIAAAASVCGGAACNQPQRHREPGAKDCPLAPRRGVC